MYAVQPLSRKYHLVVVNVFIKCFFFSVEKEAKNRALKAQEQEN